jgi:hypothetical protein
MTLEAKIYIKLAAQDCFPRKPARTVLIPDALYTISDLRQKFAHLGLESFFHDDVMLTVRKGSFTVHGGLLPGATMSSGRNDRISGLAINLDHIGRKPVFLKQADAASGFPNVIHRGTRMIRFRNV